MEKRKIQMELKDGTKRDATYAEVSARLCVRDDKNMIYEMFELSQYSDGSVLNCQLMKTWTAQEVVEDAVESTMALSGGMIPQWAKDPAIAMSTINAKSETAATEPAFRDPLKFRRCLIPADGFYEWKRAGTSNSHIALK